MRPSAAEICCLASLPMPGSRFCTTPRVLFREGEMSSWSMRRSPLESSVQPTLRCAMRYGSSSLQHLKMLARMISVATCSGLCTCRTPSGTAHSPGFAWSKSQFFRSSMPSFLSTDTMRHGQSKRCHLCSFSLRSSRRVLGFTLSTLFSTSTVSVRLPSSASCASSLSPSCDRKRLSAPSFLSSAASTTTRARSVERTASHISRCSIGTCGPSAPGASTNSTCVGRCEA